VHRSEPKRIIALATDPTRELKLSIGDHPNPCEDPTMLHAKAERCRRLAAGISDKQASEVLNGMAQGYQDAANRLTVGTSND
jgi:hypothetical protein